jgi:hypothetical protein
MEQIAAADSTYLSEHTAKLVPGYDPLISRAYVTASGWQFVTPLAPLRTWYVFSLVRALRSPKKDNLQIRTAP